MNLHHGWCGGVRGINLQSISCLILGSLSPVAFRLHCDATDVWHSLQATEFQRLHWHELEFAWKRLLVRFCLPLSVRFYVGAVEL